jgi:hypothetical protein
MNIEDVRDAARRHVSAIVDGRLDDAIALVVEDGRNEIRTNLERLTRPISGSVEDVREDKGEYVVLLSFKMSTADGFGMVLQTHWAEVDGVPLLHVGYEL